MKPLKIAIIEHMTDGHHDRVRQYFAGQQSELVYFNPAHGKPLMGRAQDYDATVVYGGVQSVNDPTYRFFQSEVAWLRDCLEQDRPVLGICLGAQLLTLAAGGRVHRHPDGLHEIGFTRISPTESGQALFNNNSVFYQWHNEGCEPGDDAHILATGDVFDCQAFRYSPRQYGVQFHPEAAGSALEGWWSSVPDMESLPGCQPLTQQRADALTCDPVIDQWTPEFLRTWQDAW